MNKTIYCNGEPYAFNYELVKLIVNDVYSDYSKADVATIINNVMWLADELDVTNWEYPYEHNLINAVSEYLKHHTVYDLDNLDDDTVIFDNIILKNTI